MYYLLGASFKNVIGRFLGILFCLKKLCYKISSRFGLLSSFFTKIKLIRSIAFSDSLISTGNLYFTSQIFYSICFKFIAFSENGTLPVNNWNMITPKAHTSALNEWP